MPKFIIPAELHPGIYRSSIGFFKPDAVMQWPDARTEELAKRNYKENPHWQLIPVDKAGYDLLKKHHPDKEIARPVSAQEPEPVDHTMTAQEAVEAMAEPEDQGQPVTEDIDLRTPQQKRKDTMAANKALRAADQ